jgi:hypothetical protein
VSAEKLLRERFEQMAVFAEYRIYWHSDTKPCLTNVVERTNLFILCVPLITQQLAAGPA